MVCTFIIYPNIIVYWLYRRYPPSPSMDILENQCMCGMGCKRTLIFEIEVRVSVYLIIIITTRIYIAINVVHMDVKQYSINQLLIIGKYLNILNDTSPQYTQQLLLHKNNLAHPLTLNVEALNSPALFICGITNGLWHTLDTKVEIGEVVKQRCLYGS